MHGIARSILSRTGATGSDAIAIANTDSRLATAVALYRAAIIDGRASARELACFREMLEDRVGVAPDELDHYEKMASEAGRYKEGYLSHLRMLRPLELETRQEVVRMMCEIAVLDCALHEAEIWLLEEAAAMLGVRLQQDCDRAFMKKFDCC